MRKALLLLAPLFATSALYACESESGSSSSGAVTPFDGGGVDAPFTPPQDGALPDTATPDAPAGPLPVTVLVKALDGSPKANVDVVFHDATGAVVAQAKTGNTGQASSPAGVAVTMASALLGTATSRNRHVVTWTGVKSADILATTDIDATSNGGPVGSYAITYPAAPGNPTAYEAYMGTCYTFQQGAGGGTINLPVYASCVRPGSTNNIVVRAIGGNTDIGYAFVKNVAAPSGQTPVAVATNAFATPGTFTVIASNRPQVFDAAISLAEIAGTQLTFNRFQGFFGPETSSTVFNGVATSYAEGFQVFSSHYVNVSEHRIIQRVAASASVTLDYGQELPGILTRTLDNTDYKRPKLTWTTAAPGLGSTDGGAVTIRWSNLDESNHGWTIVLPPSATDAKFPALPATAAAWLPPDPGDGGRLGLFQPELVFVESDLIPNADAFRQQAGIVLPFGTQDVLGNVVMPKVGKVRTVQYVEPEG